jgi:hypothetical protein
VDEYDLAIVVGDQQGNWEEGCDIRREQVCAAGAVDYAGDVKLRGTVKATVLDK